MLPTSDETIAAIATAPGIGGTGVIRISGPEAAAVLDRLFVPHRPDILLEDGLLPSHRLCYGTVKDRHGAVLDEVMAVLMRAPHTYTREDVVEIQCHGSYLVLQAILAEILRLGARAAEPGEFTKRAFLAGRIDLTQAEAVIDLLQARSMGGVELAVSQLRGELYERITAVRDALVELLAVVELALDFPDDETDILAADRLLRQVQDQVEEPLRFLLASADQGRVIREGVKAVIVGRPNVGKSSLLNQLLQEERALVTEIPGTTRDTIEELISVHGIPVHLIDTAGIREHEDAVEELGIERARRKMREADLVLFVVDASRGLSEIDRALYASLDDRKRIAILNKKDIADQGLLQELSSFFAAVPLVRTAARSGEGIPELRDTIYQAIIGQEETMSERPSCAPNLRHKMILEKTLAACAL
ncbi:MAG: tRNA uridine-5-carboxymethylaminomethyl(34) synthesis GTPase MnmE, partial [Candidatus Electrothrix sp. AUS1_2]|nr:tRNA uridine-5-carboxymethylaminomethyl(34) synthesis GTPase MnmE [Candidatus Electrothrix sp. AUS1_2]